MTRIISVLVVMFSLCTATTTVSASTQPPQAPTVKFITTPESIEVRSSTLLNCQIGSSFDFTSTTGGFVQYWAKFSNYTSVKNGPVNNTLLGIYFYSNKEQKSLSFVSLAPPGITLTNTTNSGLKSNFTALLTLSSEDFAGDYWCDFVYGYRDTPSGKVHESGSFNSTVKSTSASSFDVTFSAASAGKQEVQHEVVVSRQSFLNASCSLRRTSSDWEVLKVSFLIWEYLLESKSHLIARYTRVPAAQSLQEFNFAAENSASLEVTSDSTTLVKKTVTL